MVLDFTIMLNLLAAAIAGGLIGYERKKVHKPAGIRTHMLVCLGAALFMILGITQFASTETARISAAIVTGIGFLGAGTIFRAKDTVRGLTTAASLWVVAGIGMASGLGLYYLVVFATLLIIGILQLNKIPFFRNL